jgi:hypothetical protein
MLADEKVTATEGSVVQGQLVGSIAERKKLAAIKATSKSKKTFQNSSFFL